MSFRASLVRLAQKKSSTAWLSRQYRDPYVKQRAIGDYHSRSAFKLLEILDKYDDFLDKSDVKVVVDLGAAPGGWSQVVAQRLGWSLDDDRKPAPEFGLKTRKGTSSGARPPKTPLTNEVYDPLNIDGFEEELRLGQQGKALVVAVDVLPVRPIRGVQSLKADFLHPDTEQLIRGLIDPNRDRPAKVDVVLSDIAANMTGHADHDAEANLEVCQAVFKFVQKYLRTAGEIGRTRGGVLLLKHFMHPDITEFRRTVLEKNFRDVLYYKPQASRNESKEGYFLCRGWEPQFSWGLKREE